MAEITDANISFLFENLCIGAQNGYGKSGNDVVEAYVRTVKVELKNVPNAYPTFVYILRSYAGNEISRADMFDEVKRLFGNRQVLLDNFHIFLSAIKQQPGKHDYFMPTIQEALSFIKFVNSTFCNPEKYNRFLKLMADHRSERVDRETLVGLAKDMFKPYPSLWIGFTLFLPKQYEGNLKM